MFDHEGTGSVIYQQASPLDCQTRQSQGRLSGAAPETPGKYVTAHMYFLKGANQ